VFGTLFTSAVDTLLFPFELVKTRLQVQGQTNISHSCPQYLGTNDAISKIYKQEGLKGFSKGLAPALVVSIPTQILYFGGYEYSRYCLSKLIGGNHKSDAQDFLIEAAAGGIAEIISGTVWVPGDLVSQRLMIQGPDKKAHLYNGLADACRKILKTEGFSGLYVGFAASMCTHIPFSAVTWAVYEQSRRYMYRGGSADNADADGSHAVNAVAGLIGGAVGGAVSTPFDVVRVRQQAEGARPDARQYRGLRSALAEVVRQHGWRGLMRGVVPRMLGAAPSTAIMLVGYEFVKNQCLKAPTI